MSAGTTVIPSISGIAALDFMHALEELVGAAAYARALERLKPELREQLVTVTAMSWVPNDTVNQLIDALSAESGTDPDQLIEQAIRSAVNRTFKTVWRMFLKLTSDEALIKRTPMIYARGRNIGELNSRIIAPGHAEVLLTGWPADVHERTLFSIGIGVQCVVDMSGRKDVRMSYKRTPDGARYELTWRV